MLTQFNNNSFQMTRRFSELIEIKNLRTNKKGCLDL